MPLSTPAPPTIDQTAPGEFSLAGSWTAAQAGELERQLRQIVVPGGRSVTLNGARVEVMDSAGVWLLQRLLHELRRLGIEARLRDWPPQYAKLMELVAPQVGQPPPMARQPRFLERVGRQAEAAWQQGFSLLGFIGECTLALVSVIRHPTRLRVRPMLYNLQTAGFNALPIVALTSLLLGVVVAYQGAEQLRRYGAGIFVVDLIGYSILREFAPMMTAIIVAGRSGSAYAAQIGTMVVTEEVDALRTIGIDPIDLLVLPKVIALLVGLPLLTVFSSLMGVTGGMIMARAKLGIGTPEFLDRFSQAIETSALLIGSGKALVFALIIAVIGCFQGFRTRGSADSVGRQTTTSVVQSIFLVIVVDAVFSVLFSVLGL